MPTGREVTILIVGAILGMLIYLAMLAFAANDADAAEPEAKTSQISEFAGPLLKARRSGLVPPRRAMCGRYARVVFATSRGRTVRRALRQVRGNPDRFRNVARGTVRLRAKCVFPRSGREQVFLAESSVYARRWLRPHVKCPTFPKRGWRRCLR